MKILIISPNPQFGGASTANRNIAAMLAKSGHEVVYADEFYKNPDENAGFQTIGLPVYKNRLTKKYKTVRYIKENGFDTVICGVSQMMAFYMFHLLYLRLFHKVQIGVIFHSLCVAKNFKGRIYEYMIALSTLVANHLFYVSAFTQVCWEKFCFVRWSGAKPHVIHNAVPDAEIKKIEADKPRIAFVGRLSAEKRPQLFCSYAQELSDSYDFVIWGDGPMSEELMKEHSSKVKFMGYESNAERIYSNTDILMMTSEFENCPMVILEARTYGVPVITVNVGGISEILKDGYNGLFFSEDESPASLKEKIENIISHYAAYQKNCKDSAITLDKAAALWDKAVKE